MGSPARVLIVDDSPTILKVVSAILTRHGYEPAVARDGIGGIEMIKRGPKFDLVLLDFVMPRMNGYQFCRELRSNPAHRSLPVVLMSAKGDKIRGQFVQQTGAVDAITKPFDARALVAVIEGALAKTAEGRARPVPEGHKMPDEDSLAESLRPAQVARQQRLKSAGDVALQVAQAVLPHLMALSSEDRQNEAAVHAAVTRSISADVLDALAMMFENLEAEGGVKELMGGDIAAIPLAEILQVLQMQRQTGVLRVSNARAAVTISIRQGFVDFVQARGGPDEYRLGRYFVEQGVVTREQLDQVLRTKVPAGQLTGEALIDAWGLHRDALREALTKQSAELIYDVLRWPYGRFSFTREAFTDEAETAKLGIGIAGLVLEGFRRVDEWRLMEGTINFDQVVSIDPVALDAIGEERLTRIDKLVIGAVNGTRTVNEVIKESAVGSFDAIKAVYQFLHSRVIRPRAV